MEPARPATTSQQDAPWRSSSPPSAPQEKNQQPTQKCLPSKSSITSVCPRDISHRQVSIRESSASDPCKGFPPKTSKRPRVDTIKNASVEPSCHCTGTATVVHSNQNVTYVIRDALRTTKSHLKTSRSTIPPPSVMRSRARAMNQDYPFTGPSPGPTSTPIPPPFHRLGETHSNISIFFFLTYLCPFAPIRRCVGVFQGQRLTDPSPDTIPRICSHSPSWW